MGMPEMALKLLIPYLGTLTKGDDVRAAPRTDSY